MFLTMMGEHLYDFDAEAELLAAFECFDEGDSGFVKCDEIRKWLGDVGERMDESEVSVCLACCGFMEGCQAVGASVQSVRVWPLRTRVLIPLSRSTSS